MFQVMNQTIRIATRQDAYDAIPSSGERAARARRQADALALASRALQQEEELRQARARARAELATRAAAQAALREDEARRCRPAPLFGRRPFRLSGLFRRGAKAA